MSPIQAADELSAQTNSFHGRFMAGAESVV